MSTPSDARAPLPAVDDATLQALLDALADPVLALDAEQRVRHVNAGALALLSMGGGAGTWEGHPVRQALPDSALWAAIDTPTDSVGRPSEWVHSATERVFQPRLARLGGGWLLTLRDVTPFKRMLRNQYEFTRIVAHDLRSPLASVLGFASMLHMRLPGELNDKQVAFLDKMIAGLNQMTAIVDNIQDAGRYDPATGFYELERAACDVGALVRRVVQTFLMPAEKQELSLDVTVVDDLPIVSVDAHMLERAITNLVDNAIKYTPNGGHVRVAAVKDGEAIVVRVQDDGLGIAPEHQAQLFERHVRLASRGQHRVKGSGLGLFIVRSVAQHHDGEAWVDSVPGQGATFSLRLPLRGANLIGGAAAPPDAP